MRQHKASRRLGRLLSQLLPPLGPSSCAAAASSSQEEQEESWAEYRDKAVKRALELGNRGPIRFDSDGKLAKEIQDAYWTQGFYVFENVMRPEELAEIQAEIRELLENAPASKGSTTDKHGRPVRFPRSYDMVVPHQDPAKVGQDPPPHIVGNLLHPLMTMDSTLRLYGHPDLLRVVEAFNGPDFTNFGESIFNKAPGEGQATNWHQDGRTHWNEDGLPGRPKGLPPRQPGVSYPENLGCHGFSFHGAFSNCVPEQCLWVLPGSHKQLYTPHWVNGKFQLRDAEGRPNYTVESAFTSGEIARIPGVVPMLMRPGDVGIHNRSCLHGSFPSSSPERRLTMVFRFFNRRDVINQRARNKLQKKSVQRYKDKGYEVDHTRRLTMSEAHIHDKTRMIQLAIDARRERFPDETPYVYRPLVGEEMPDREAFRKDYCFSFGIDL